MASAGLLTDRAELEGLFGELADELSSLGVEAEIVMVGGSWMLWHSQRAATRDVDSARRFDVDLTDAIERLGARHDLSKGWLNDAAAAFWPSGASLDDCEIVYQRAALLVRTPSPDIVFIMKLYRSDPQDREDMVLLWPMCGFADSSEAEAVYWSGYPHAPEDKFLGGYIADIAADARRH
jgi:hypothetical protein